MKVELQSKESNAAKFLVHVEYDKFEEKIQEIYLKNRQYFTIPGFRKGKAPRKIIEMNYGEGIFYEDAINEMIPDIYEDAVEELELEPVAQPSVDIEELVRDETLILAFEVDIKPVPELGDYSNLQAEIPKLEANDEMVEQKIKQDLEANVRLVEKEVAEEGDVVNIDYLGEVDGVAFEGGEDTGHDLELGSGSFIPGFEEQLIGLQKDEKVDVQVTFPENYHAENLSGKDAVFHVTINSVKGKEYPALDDEFAMDVSEFDTLEEYRAHIREQLEKEVAERKESERKSAAIRALVGVSRADIPESMILSAVDEEMNSFGQTLAQAGLNMEQYLELANMTEEMLKTQFYPTAYEKIMGDLVLTKFTEEQNIEATDEELDEEIKAMAENFGREDLEDFKDQLEEFGSMSFVEGNVKRRKAIEKLVEITTFTETDINQQVEEETDNEEETEE